MNIICSPKGIVDIDRPGQGVADIKNAGFAETVLDFSLLRYRNHKYTGSLQMNNPGSMKRDMTVFTGKCNDNDLKYSVAKAPCFKNALVVEEDNELLASLAREAVEVCGSLGCRRIIVPPLYAGIPNSDLWEVNREFYAGLIDSAKAADVVILLENQCKNINGHLVRGACSDGNEVAQWIDSLNAMAGEKCFGFCLNVGVCNLCGQNMYDFIKAVGNRLLAVEVSDGDGNSDNAMMPFTAVSKGKSRTDWLSLIRGLREMGFDGEFILNIEDTAAAVSPILRPGLLQYGKSVMDYLAWQINIEKTLKKYDSRVLFGAGNMCRNYMKCYGEEYPPLYTCDNNSKIWGSEFCGLKVNNPEALRELSEDTAIFICNVYYREIEKQLRNMGLTNPIEFFNDEYMSSFYFDRLEGDGRK